MFNFLGPDSDCYSDLKSKHNNSRRQNRCKYKKWKRSKSFYCRQFYDEED